MIIVNPSTATINFPTKVEGIIRIESEGFAKVSNLVGNQLLERYGFLREKPEEVEVPKTPIIPPPPEEKTIEEYQELYKEKFNISKVPSRYKNDVEWIKSKLNS